MANTFEEQARDRLGRSLQFLDKSQALLHDDLIYRSALADAVSAIKNMLQGYLLLKIAATPLGPVTQRWQETASSNSMPDLIAACSDAGLDLRGLAVEIKRLNSERTYRTHEDPQRLVDAEQAAHAIKIARDVQQRIKEAVQGRHKSLPVRAAQVARSAVSGQIRLSPQAAAAVRAHDTEEAFGDTSAFAASVAVAPAPPADGQPVANGRASAQPLTADRDGASDNAASRGAGKVPAAAAGLPDADDADDALDTGDVAAIKPPRRRGPIGRALLRAALAASLLIVGAAAGVGVTIPVASGHAPGWLGFATHLLPASATATASPSPTATPATTGPVTLGALLVAAPVCQAGKAAIALTNTGAQPLDWAAGGTDAGTLIAPAAGATGQASVSGILQGGASVTFSVTAASSAAHIVVVAPGGAISLLVNAC
ncbi:MAG TPA: hypothetical protein VGS80_03710 [Ktedonobacterales bacterium]|nr:hypothetical protein [Ktedonobacterales bacterium]